MAQSTQLNIGDRVAYDGEGESAGLGRVVNKIFDAEEGEFLYVVAWDGSEDPDQEHIIADLRLIPNATSLRYSAYQEDEIENRRTPMNFLDFEMWEGEHGNWCGAATS